MSSSGVRRHAGLIVGLLASTAAHAHFEGSALGPIYGGFSHLLLAPERWLAIVALAMLCGLRDAATVRGALGALVPAWLLGGLAAMMMSLPLQAEVVNAALLLSVGAALAAAPNLSSWPAIAAGALVGLARGIADLSGAQPTANHFAGLLSMTGAGAALFIVIGAMVVKLERPFWRIAIRVLGSWIAASGILLLGWIVHRS